MKKIFATLMAVLMTFSLLVSCGTNSEDVGSTATDSTNSTSDVAETGDLKTSGLAVSDKGVLPIVEETVELEVFIPQNTNVSDYEDNKLTAYLEETTNVKVNWVIGPEADVASKVNLLFAANAGLPDIFLGSSAAFSNAALTSYIDQGLILPISDYFDDYCTYIFDGLEAYPEAESMITAYDGKIYGFPQFNATIPNGYSKRLWINQTWLDTLNLDMPTTTEEFEEVLIAFRDDDPNGNGIQDEIPFIGANTGWDTSPVLFIMNSFIQYDSTTQPYRIVDGVVDAVYDSEEYRNGLRYLNSLAEQGLLDTSSFTQDNSQLKQLVENTDNMIVGTVSAGGPGAYSNTNSDRYPQYSSVTSLVGSDGYQNAGRSFPNVLTSVGIITSECEVPEIAVKWLDNMYSEDVSLRQRLGEPEVDWELITDTSILSIKGEPAYYREILKWGSVQNSHWNAVGPSNMFFADTGETSDDPANMPQILWDATQDLIPYGSPTESMLPTYMYSLDDSAEMADISATLESYIYDSAVRFITGAMDIEDGWDAYIGELQNIGYERYVEIIQARYDEINA